MMLLLLFIMTNQRVECKLENWLIYGGENEKYIWQITYRQFSIFSSWFYAYNPCLSYQIHIMGRRMWRWVCVKGPIMNSNGDVLTQSQTFITNGNYWMDTTASKFLPSLLGLGKGSKKKWFIESNMKWHLELKTLIIKLISIEEFAFVHMNN